MFQLHDKTRRKLAIAGFVLLCLLPTCAVAGWCLWRNMSWETRIAAEQLERQLGWKVKLEQLKHPRPGVDVYENLELIDAETGGTIFRSPSIEVRWGENADPQSKDKPVLVLSLDRPEIDAAALDRIGRCIERVLQKQTAPDVNCLLSAAELKLRQGKNVRTFPGIEAGVVHSDVGVQAALQFHLPGAEAAVPAVIRIFRNRTIAPPQSRIELNTGDNELPCELIALGSSAFGELGSQTRFRGELIVYYSQQNGGSADWSGEIVGQLLDVDLKALASDSSDHKISGQAEIMLDKPTYFTGGRLESLNAQVNAGPGVVSHSLMQACVEKLGFETGFDLGIADAEIKYQQLAFGLLIDAQGLRIRGRCPFRHDGKEVRGAIMIDRNLCLLADPPAQPCPIASLIQALAPPSESQVPATQQADRFLRHLPLPSETGVR